MTSNARVVVIGAGLAGVRLAQRLGELGMPALLIGEEEHAPYNRVLLAEVLAGRYAPEVIALPAYGGLLRGRVTGIDRAARTVRCADGSVIAYDALVLATGSNPVLPPLRGLFGEREGELPEGVHAFRTMDDCLGLSEAVRPGVRAVVIGGGLLGVSAARALAARGAQVVLAQQAERLMERQLDPAASKLVLRYLRDLGVEVHTECRVRDVRCEGGAVRSVELADGYALDADLVVLACGIRPRTKLAEDAGLAVHRGVLVDDELYYPGDSYTVPEGVEVGTLAAPIGAPWLKVGEAMDFVLAVKPKRAFFAHELTLSVGGKQMHADRLKWATEQSGGAWMPLEVGDSLDL